MNKKERRLALATALQSAAQDMLVVDSVSSDGKVGKPAAVFGRPCRVRAGTRGTLCKHALPVSLKEGAGRQGASFGSMLMHWQQSPAASWRLLAPPRRCAQTKALVQMLTKVGAAADKKVLLVLSSWDETTVRAGRNVDKLAINTADRLQVFDVLNADVIVIEKAALAKVKELYAPSASA